MFDIEKLKDHLKKEEGYRNTVYKDHLGFKTIGYGHLVKPNEKFVEGKVYSDKELEKIFDYDVNIAINDAKKLCEGLDINEQAVEIIAHMCFQLGRTKTAKFKKRASRLAEQMKKLT